jgi:phosphoribosylformylglycinamidine synthase
MIGVIGLLHHPLTQAVPIGWPQKTPAQILLVGAPEAIYAPTLGASHYLRDWLQVRYSPPPALHLAAERALLTLLPRWATLDWLLAAQDVSDGGLLLALLEIAWASGVGFVAQKPPDVRRDAFWFGEDGARIIVAVRPEEASRLIQEAEAAQLAVWPLGETRPAQTYACIEDQTLDLRLLKALSERTLPYLIDE